MTTLPAHDAPTTDVRPRTISRRATGADAVFVHSSRMIGATVLVITGGVGIFLGWQAFPTLRHYGFSFFTEASWQPEADVLGIAAVLTGTVCVALVAMTIAFPLALLTALYISEYSPASIRSLLVSLVDLMAAVPSIIWGLWGYFLVMPYAADLGVWLDRNLGWIPFFDVHNADPNAAVPDVSRYSFSMFAAGIAVAIMVEPRC